jgi:hypothetical protein
MITEGTEIMTLRQIIILEIEVIGDSRPKFLANSIDVSLNNSIDPIMMPVSLEVIATLEAICACLS